MKKHGNYNSNYTRIFKIRHNFFIREAIKEDDEGFLEASVADIIQRAKRKRQQSKKGNSKLGMMRHLYVILDCSDSMSAQDLKPTRLLCTIKVDSIPLISLINNDVLIRF